MATSENLAIYANNKLWQGDPDFNLGPFDAVYINAAGQWVTHPPDDGGHGAGGRQGHVAADYYYQPGSNEGCLLMLVSFGSDNKNVIVQAFDKDDEIYKIDGPVSSLVFAANDDQDPKPPGLGYTDNRGYLTVYLSVNPASPPSPDKVTYLVNPLHPLRKGVLRHGREAGKEMVNNLDRAKERKPIIP